MANATAKQLSEVVGVSVEKLLEQLKDAGVEVSGPDDPISNKDKTKLLKSLRISHGKSSSDAPKKITLKGRSQSELKVGASSRTLVAKTINVEVRKKKTFVRPNDNINQATESATDEAKYKRQREAAIEEARSVKLRADDEARQVQIEAETARLKRQEEIAEKERANKAKAVIKKEKEIQAQIEKQRQLKIDQGKLQKAKEVKKQLADEKATKNTNKANANKANANKANANKANANKANTNKANTNKAKGNTRYGRDQLHLGKDSGRKKSKGKGRRGKKNEAIADNRHGFEKPTAPVIKNVSIPDTIAVSDLAKQLAVKAADVVKELMKMGIMATINQILDQDTAILLVEEMGHTASISKQDSIEDELIAALKKAGGVASARPPVVTIMGHVDHGKTSLLDYIRQSRVANSEAGGITQHIGAYHVATDQGMITFLDTPGHAAFSAMRQRGAQATDIVVLVVAADDGVMPQTKEAVKHAKDAGVGLVIAVNKIDKEGADLDRVRNELSAIDVIPEEWGGDIIFKNVSALTGAGVEELLESILLQSEIMELTSTAEGNAKGIVIESTLDKGRGPVATILIQAGTLKKGDILLAGTEYGRVRGMTDENGKQIKAAGPSIPVQVIGLSSTPNAGDDVFVVENDRKAREIAGARLTKIKDIRMAEQQKSKLQGMFDAMENTNVGELTVLIKADVKGSAEALRHSLNALSTDEVKVSIVSDGVGGINESDVNLAATSQAILVGFNVRADASAKRIAGDFGLDIRYYSVIYDVIDDIKAGLSGLLPSETKENIIGLAEVKDTFTSPKFGTIAGSIVIEGQIRRGLPIRVLRDDTVIYEGQLESLRRFKNDVDKVNNGTECGIGVKNYTDVQAGDQIEVFERFEIARTLD